MEMDWNVLIWSVINWLVLIAIIVAIVKFFRRQRRIEEKLDRIEAIIKREPQK